MSAAFWAELFPYLKTEALTVVIASSFFVSSIDAKGPIFYKGIILDAMAEVNPYKIEAGPQLDLLIHTEFLGKPQTGEVPRYSTDNKLVEEVRSKLKARKDAKIIIGQSHLRSRRWFARHEKDPSTGTEVMAETYSLAICRLALLVVHK